MASIKENLTDARVLAIASHVSFGYVGNKMATFVMQALGCDVSAIDTVHFSNHTAYKQWTGRKVPAEEIQQLYDGLKRADLGPFDMMLSGYIASKEAVAVVGSIARDLRLRASMKPGSFFWVLDPVMGDNGSLYVAEDIVPIYRSLLREADLILPNCFEAEQLSESKITDMSSLIAAIGRLHNTYRVPNIIVTSVPFSVSIDRKRETALEATTLAVVGSSCKSGKEEADFSPRIFSITVPSLPIFFSGTGDMFAALTVARLREAVAADELLDAKSWLPPDHVAAAALPLAKATEKTLSSMHVILSKTAKLRDAQLEAESNQDVSEATKHLRQTKASEIRIVKYMEDLRRPIIDEKDMFKAEEISLS